MTSQPVSESAPTPAFSRYIYGTTRLGDDRIARADRVNMAHAAMAAGVWFHTSHQYGDALQVLRAAFDEDRSRVPKLILKVGGDTIAEFRANILRQLDALGLQRLDVAQLCIGGALAEEFRTGGRCYDDFRALKAEGLVGGYVGEVFPWTSAGPLEAWRAGYPVGVVDACIFYLNPLQRFASNALWDLIVARGIPVVGMRTVCGAPVHTLRDVPGAAWKDYLRQRAIEVAPVYERSGVTNWTEFCVRFSFGFPMVRATVGSTSRGENLREFLTAAHDPRPLAADVQEDLVAFQRRWSETVDGHAEPWTM